METSPRGRAVFGAFGVLVLGVALRVVRRSPWLTWLALVLAILLVLLSVISAFAPHSGLTIATAALEAAFYFLRDREPDRVHRADGLAPHQPERLGAKGADVGRPLRPAAQR